MHLAEEDEFISKAAQAEIKAALAKKPKTTVYSYPGQNHAFSRIRLGHESQDVRLTYLKGKDAESEEAQEHSNSSSPALYA